MTSPLDRLQQRLGYGFADAALLDRALSHRSIGGRNNERLEFLGDALVNFVIAEALYAAKPMAEEGALSRLRASGDTSAGKSVMNVGSINCFSASASKSISCSAPQPWCFSYWTFSASRRAA